GGGAPHRARTGLHARARPRARAGHRGDREPHRARGPRRGRASARPRPAVSAPRAVIFDLGGTLVHWPDWDEGAAGKWSLAYDAMRVAGDGTIARWPEREEFVAAMRAAELAHWERVDREHWSGPPTGLVSDGLRRLDLAVRDEVLVATMDGYAKAVAGWATVYPDSHDTLVLLRERGYRVGLLSNTWWAAEWYN